MNWITAPILLPLFTALFALVGGKPSRTRRLAAGLSALLQLLVACAFLWSTCTGRIHVLPVGNWTAQIGIILVVDLLSSIMLVLCSLTYLATLLYGFAETGVRIEHPLRLPLSQLLVTGIQLAFCTGDLFNLFVAFEIMLVSSYALLTLEADDWDIKQAYPYVAINLVGSTLFISAAGMAYGMFGTLNFAEISLRAGAFLGEPRFHAWVWILMVVFGIKAGLFPLYYWLPHAYPTLPIPLAALYAGMLTKVGVYVFLRIFCTVLPHELAQTHAVLAWLAGFTMLFGVIGAISRNFIRGILSFHIVSQIGFMLLAVGLFTPLSIAAAILYVMHHILVKASLFLIGGVVSFLNRTDDLERTGNLWTNVPWLGVFFLIQGLSLAGLPPLSGFWGKYMILLVGLQKGAYVLVGAAVLASVLTLVSMLKIWHASFLKTDDRIPVRRSTPRGRWMIWVVGMVTAVSLCIGLGVEIFLKMAIEAARQAMDSQQYSQAILPVVGKNTMP